MNPINLTALLHRSESETLDFKSKQYPFAGATDAEKGELLKDILSFANAWKESDAYILVGVEEENGRAKNVCGADTTLDDANVQQFVSTKTNRPVSFRIEVRKHKGKSLTIIQIDKTQDRPIFLLKSFGQLRSKVAYVRRGSSTEEATPDEIVEMGREGNALQQEEEKKHAKKEKLDRFWREFKIFLHDFECKVQYHKATTSHIVYDNIIENRLPLDEVNLFKKTAEELELDPELRKKINKLVEDVKIIDAYIDRGADFINKSISNFKSKQNSLYELVSAMKHKYVVQGVKV